MLEIVCYYFPGCASLGVLPERLAAALAAEGIAAQVHHEVLSAEQGLARGVRGSPTVLINGQDISGVASSGAT